MALSPDTQPHFATMAEFISISEEEVTELFRGILLIYNKMGLIGKEMFAMDGCKVAVQCLNGVERERIFKRRE